LLAYAALWKAVILEFFLYRSDPLPPRQWRETILGPATLGIVWLYASYVFLSRFRRALVARAPLPQPTPPS
jgi:hypothetical protein